jgi:biofilm PGA synthesis N-glycosyltransferase PgaC
MHFWETIFFISCFLIFYNYAGYALIARALNAVKKITKGPAKKTADFYPTVSFIVAAFNEEDFIAQKAVNSLQQEYPGDKIEYIFITDGSTDRTADIISAGYPSIRLLHEDERKGKSAAVNRAVLQARHDILIFSDANTHLNQQAVKNIARHYIDEKVGGVSGEKKVIPATGNRDEVGAGEGFYWKYESFLKKVDSEFYSVVGAAGELFSLRKNLYEPIPDKVILDDFIISLRAAGKGYRILYEPAAYAMESPSFSVAEEHKRKIRISAGGFQSIGMLWPLLLFWRQPALSFLYISHRVLRWTLSPLCFILAFLSNGVLVFLPGVFFKVFFAAQALFYVLAIAGKFAQPGSRLYKVLRLPYYFVFMNISVIQGFFRFLKGRQAATWEKARRAQPQNLL